MKNTSIKVRLVLLVSLFIGFFIVSFIASIYYLNKMIDNADSIYQIRLKGIQFLVEADRDAYQSNLALNHLYIKEEISKDQEEALIADVRDNYAQVGQRYEKFLIAFKNSDSEQRTVLENTFDDGYKHLGDITNNLISHHQEGNDELFLKHYLNDYSPVYEEVRGVLDQFTNYSSIDAEEEFQLIHEEGRDSKIMFVIILILMIALGGGFGFLLMQSILTPLNKSIRFAKDIAEGDLKAKIDYEGKNEIGDLIESLRAMSLRLTEVIRGILQGAENVASASQQASGSSVILSQGANQQASSIEEVSSTMEEITSSIEQNTENAKQTEKTSAEANVSIQLVAEKAKEAVEANKAIAGKINIIGDIASKTDLLAINAAVEAARAGDHGKGFAVVATEVRKLAENSQKAAEEIIALAQLALRATEEAGAVMMDTIPKIGETSSLIQEVAAASMEQNNGASQVNVAIQQLNEVTQQNASSSEELAASSEELASQAEQLKEMVSFFRIGEERLFISAAQRSTQNGRRGVKPKKTPEQNYMTPLSGDRSSGFNMKDFNNSDFESF